jgi:hypothetical protein
MTVKKTKISSKSLNIPNNSGSKPSTITRAAITANTKLTRGKQLVEHSPLSLIPDPFNPRPGDQIDDDWLKKYLFIGTDNCLCRMDPNGNYVIPKFDELNDEIPSDLEEHYEFLRSLAYSIRNDGLIEPIEIFLADKNNDPHYFSKTPHEFGYVILEGHQRRLAGILSGVSTLTCIEITDETILTRLKVKHRKLRRQLSENNLRKGLSVSQNYLIAKELLLSDDSNEISGKELSSIIGLNEEIAGAIKRLVLTADKFPQSMLKLIENNHVSFKWIRTWISKPYSEIENEVSRIISGERNATDKLISNKKARGRSGGAIKKLATFQVRKEQDSKVLKEFLFRIIPEIKFEDNDGSPFHHLEIALNRLLDLAKSDNMTRVGSHVTI